MNGRYVLDTNVVIALVDGDNSVRDRVIQADELFVPTPVLGELYFGAYHSGRVAENVNRIDDLVRSYAILLIDELTAKVYGTLREQLRAKGTPLPENDIWIAALAQQHASTLATRDRHFEVIDNFAVEWW